MYHFLLTAEYSTFNPLLLLPQFIGTIVIFLMETKKKCVETETFSSANYLIVLASLTDGFHVFANTTLVV